MYWLQFPTFRLLCISVATAVAFKEETFIHPFQNFSTGDPRYQQRINLTSRIRCSAVCSKDNTCRSFSFNRETGVCTLCTKVLAEDGNKVYVKKSRLESPDDKGYMKASTSFGTIWYRTNVKEEPWLDARDICTSEGGHLFFLQSPEKQAWLADMMRTSHPSIDTFYCDGNDLDEDNVYRNYKNDVMTWGKWAPGEPNAQGGVEHCVMFRFPDESWNDIDCSVPKTFVCEIDI